MYPLVSIIIPNYNSEKYILETLQSVCRQKYSNWECLIIDDGSTDDSLSIIENYVKDDIRFIIKKKKSGKKGASLSRNIGINFAKGKYIQFLDSDDLISSNKIKNQIQLLESVESNLTLATSKWRFFVSDEYTLKITDEKLEYKNFDSIYDYFNLVGRVGGFFPIHSFLINSELIKRAGKWNENLNFNDDGEFIFRVLIASDRILFEKNSYAFYRRSIKSLSQLNSKEKAISLIKSWQIIEKLFILNFRENNSAYLNNKKTSVYNEVKKKYPSLIKENKQFFRNQIKKDKFVKKTYSFLRKLFNKCRTYFK